MGDRAGAAGPASPALERQLPRGQEAPPQGGSEAVDEETAHSRRARGAPLAVLRAGRPRSRPRRPCRGSGRAGGCPARSSSGGSTSWTSSGASGAAAWPAWSRSWSSCAPWPPSRRGRPSGCARSSPAGWVPGEARSPLPVRDGPYATVFGVAIETKAPAAPTADPVLERLHLLEPLTAPLHPDPDTRESLAEAAFVHAEALFDEVERGAPAPPDPGFDAIAAVPIGRDPVDPGTVFSLLVRHVDALGQSDRKSVV